MRRSESIVSEEKVLGYLLSPDHPVGSAKALFFRALGYSRDDWTRLRDDLADIGKRGEVIAQEETPFGWKYVVDGAVRAPAGRVVVLRTVWIADGPEDPPRLVTAYPG